MWKEVGLEGQRPRAEKWKGRIQERQVPTLGSRFFISVHLLTKQRAELELPCSETAGKGQPQGQSPQARDAGNLNPKWSMCTGSVWSSGGGCAAWVWSGDVRP